MWGSKRVSGRVEEGGSEWGNKLMSEPGIEWLYDVPPIQDNLSWLIPFYLLPFVPSGWSRWQFLWARGDGQRSSIALAIMIAARYHHWFGWIIILLSIFFCRGSSTDVSVLDDLLKDLQCAEDLEHTAVSVKGGVIMSSYSYVLYGRRIKTAMWWSWRRCSRSWSDRRE